MTQIYSPTVPEARSPEGARTKMAAGQDPPQGPKCPGPSQPLKLHLRFHRVPSPTVQASRAAPYISGHTASFFCVRSSFASLSRVRLQLHLGVCPHHKIPNVITSLKSLPPYKPHSQVPGVRISWESLFSLPHTPSSFPRQGLCTACRLFTWYLPLLLPLPAPSFPLHFSLPSPPPSPPQLP